MYKRTRWGFTFFALLVALCIYLVTSSRIQLGIDLRGGTELTYALDLSRIERDRAKVATEVKDIIAKRLNAYGLKEISVSVQGQDHLVIQLPGTDSQSVAELKKQIEQAGNLNFRLLAGSEHQSSDRIEEYEKAEQRYLDEDRVWVQKKIDDPSFSEERPKPPDYIVRSEVEKVNVGGDRQEFRPKPGGKKALENFHGEYNKKAERWETQGVVSGRFLSRVAETVDPSTFKPAVHFEFKGEGTTAFSDLTGANVGRALCIVLDDDIMEIATIRDRITGSGQLSGNFTSEDVRGIVTILRGGSLPTKPTLISESTVGAILGQDSIESGVEAVVIGGAGVMLSMAIYYMVGGLVADFALAINVLFILTFMVAFRQTLTMPGLAGILLTIGMSVDANILIFERYREERKKGKPLAQSLGAGYDRAFWVIFDSNLTTLITGYVLFYMGSPEVKGFAVTLISGIFASFFTAVFVTRLILSLLVNVGIIKDVKMMEAFQTPRVPFVRHQKAFIGASIAIIVSTWLVVLWRGKENYGIDFTGGARVTMNLTKPVKVDVMREKIAGLAAREPELFRDYSIQTVHSEGVGESRTFTVLTRAGSASVGAKVANAEEPAAEQPAPAPAASGAPATTVPEAPKAEAPAPEPEKPAPAPVPGPVTPPAVPSEGDLATVAVGAAGEEKALVEEPAQLVRKALEGLLTSEGLLVPPPFPNSNWKNAEAGTAGGQFFEQEVNLYKVGVDLSPDRFKSELNAWLAKDPLMSRANRDEKAAYKGIEVTSVELLGKPTAEMPVTRYVVRTSAYQPPLEAAGRDRTLPTRKQVEDAVRGYFRQGAGPETLQISEPFPQVLTVGPRVASGLQTDALVALFISLLGIVFYLSLRFEFIYGLAGILALVHDTMVAIGIMAVTDQFLSSAFPVKFNLTELAAILTIIGFSINDTIVLFDRIRENSEILAKKKYTLEDLVDISVNQTLSRTLWTSLTVLLVLVITLAFGGESVRGFAYIFAVGTIAGVYSTVFVASPIVIWLHNRAMARRRAMAALSA